MNHRNVHRNARRVLLLGVMAVAFAGCAMSAGSTLQTAGGPQAAATPIPRVQNCAVLNTGTPSRFACNGKTYTSYQLAKIRENEAKKLAAAN